MTLQEQFITERKVFKGVSPATVLWYEQSLKRFEGALESREAIGRRIMELRQRGLSPISINTYLRCVRAYLNWAYGEGHIKERIKVGYIKAEQKVIATLSPEQVRQLIAFRPRGTNATRCHVAVCLLLDTGLRISEALGLRREDVDFDNLLLRVVGKGGKHRQVPMSLELRKMLFRYLTRQQPQTLRGQVSPGQFVFATRSGTRVTVRNFERGLRIFGKRVGITGVRFSPHTLRHTFAISYLRAGGNLFYLSKILGHSSVKTTERYLQSVQTGDLQAVHQRFSLLATAGILANKIQNNR